MEVSLAEMHSVYVCVCVCIISAVNTLGRWQWPATVNHRKQLWLGWTWGKGSKHKLQDQCLFAVNQEKGSRGGSLSKGDGRKDTDPA